MVPVSGNTYPVKDQLKALGGKWNPDAKCWMIPANKADEARKLVAGAKSVPFSSRPATGKCAKCGSHTDRNRAGQYYRLCLNCVDGGGNAHGGQSYYDRGGAFILGDDD